MVGLCLSSPHLTSPHLVLLHFRFGKTVTNLNTIGRVATSEILGICLLIRLFQSSGFRGLLDALLCLSQMRILPVQSAGSAAAAAGSAVAVTLLALLVSRLSGWRFFCGWSFFYSWLYAPACLLCMQY